MPCLKKSAKSGFQPSGCSEGRYPEAETLTQEIRAVDQRVLGRDNPATAVTVYDLAFLAALQGHREQAPSALHEALDHGLSPRLAAGIETDDDLKSLRGEPGFAAVVASARQHAAAAQKTN